MKLRARAWDRLGFFSPLLVLFLCVVPFSAWAQKGTITVTLDPPRAFVGEPVKLSIELVLGGSLQKFEAPPLDGFDVIAGQWPPNTPSVMISGGMFRVPLEDVYITATRPGTLSLGAVRATVDGEVIESNAVSFEAIPRPDVPPTSEPASQQAADRYDDPLYGLPATPLFPIVVHAVADREFVYPGGQVVITYWLLVRPGIRFRDLDIEAPEASNAVQRTLVPFDQRRFSGGPITWGSQSYTAFRIGRLALSPISNDAIEVKPLVFRGLAGGSIGESVTRPSESLTIQVRPLPEGQPVASASVVGRFTASASSATSEAKVGEPFPVEVVLAGVGDLSSYEPSPWRGLSGARVRPPAIKRDETPQEDKQILSRVSAQYFVIPEKPGELVLTAPAVAVLDPETGTWTLSQPEPIRVQVTGSALSVGSLGLRAARESSQLVAAQTVPGWVWGAGLALPPLLVGLFLLAEDRARKRRAAGVPLAPVREALARAERASDSAEGFREVSTALVLAAEFATQQRLRGGTSQELCRAVAASLGDGMAGRVASLLEIADRARFAQAKTSHREALPGVRGLVHDLTRGML